MKPATFHYLRPKTINEAIEYLSRKDGESRVLAGGQSLVPILNFRLSRFDYLIDINYIDELAYIRRDGDMLRIGAMTRQRTIETSPLVASAAPLLQEVTRSIGHLPTRSRGTIGGSVAHADPAAEYPATLIALGATMVAQGDAGKREIRADDFFKDIYSTALGPNELLVEIMVPVAQPGQVFGFEEFCRRKGDLAVIGIVGAFSIVGDRIASARLVAFGLASAPQRISEAEAILQDRAAHQIPLDDVARVATSNVNTQSDIAATAELRSHLAGILARRVVSKAFRSRSKS